MAVSGLFLDSQIETKSGSSRSGGQLDPASGTWSNEASNSFGHDVTNVRNSSGAGNYSHDRYGFEVSGAITVANENNYRMHHSTTHVYVDGNLTNLDWCHPLFVVTSAVMAASSANAARDTAFAEMAEETETIGDPEDPASQASADSL